jgi:hypothetical protein
VPRLKSLPRAELIELDPYFAPDCLGELKWL